MNESDRTISRASSDPAADAAAMLLRLGFAIFALVIPSATLMSRWVIVVLVPIGAVLIILAALVRGDPSRLGSVAMRGLTTLPGVMSVLLIIWAAASLSWTPFPGDAFEKLLKACGVVVLGALAVFALPGRMRASNLHLVTIGAAIGGFLILIAGVSEMIGMPILRFPAATPGRVAVLLTSLVWVGAAWMLIKNRPTLAVALVIMIVIAITLSSTVEAITPLVVGVIVLGAAWNAPERIGRMLALLLGGMVMFAPLLAWFAKIGTALPALASLTPWWDIVAADPLHVITGRGFDAANAARAVGLIPVEARVGFVSDLWFDLGLLGALGFASLVFCTFRAAGRFGLEVAPAALAALSAAFVFAIFERGATQTWWLNGMVVFAIVLMSVERGRYRTVRPRAWLKHRKNDA